MYKLKYTTLLWCINVYIYMWSYVYFYKRGELCSTWTGKQEVSRLRFMLNA